MKKLYTYVIVRLFLAVTFAALAVVVKWHDIRWGFMNVKFLNTPLFFVSIAFVVALLLSAFLRPTRELYRQKRLPIVQNLTEKIVEGVYNAFSRLDFQFAFWGSATAVLIILAVNVNLLRDRDYRLNQVAIPWIPAEMDPRGLSVSPSTTSLTVWSSNNDQIDYLANCVKIVRDLKDVGAKVVFVPLSPKLLKKSLDLIEELNKTGIVVFGVKDFIDRSLKELIQKRNIRVGRVGEAALNPPTTLSFIHKIDPYPAPMYGLRLPDASFEILRLYRNVAVEEPLLHNKKGELEFGDMRYPVDERGAAYVGGLSVPLYPAPVSVHYGEDDAYGLVGTTKLVYVHAKSTGTIDTYDNLITYRDSFSGKIVLLDRQDDSALKGFLDYYREAFKTAQVVNDLVDGRVLRPSKGGSILVGVIAILGCGLILYRSGLIAGAALLALFSVAILSAGPWLFYKEQILIDVPAVLASLVLSIVVFLILRAGYAWRGGFHASLSKTGEKSPAFELVGRRISLSPALAGAITILVVIVTALIARSGGETRTPSSEKEVVYVTSLPTVEVQGLPIQTSQ